MMALPSVVECSIHKFPSCSLQPMELMVQVVDSCLVLSLSYF